MDITNEWIKWQIKRFSEDELHARGHGHIDAEQESKRWGAALRELLSRREAEEGEVVVEGYAESKVFDGVPWEVRGLGKAHAELRFYDLPMPGTVSAVVTLRRRAEQTEDNPGV